MKLQGFKFEKRNTSPTHDTPKQKARKQKAKVKAKAQSLSLSPL